MALRPPPSERLIMTLSKSRHSRTDSLPFFCVAYEIRSVCPGAVQPRLDNACRGGVDRPSLVRMRLQRYGELADFTLNLKSEPLQ